MLKNHSKGFTLIELLIVIALLGALAVGLLAALDPFEQLKKGTDTGTRSTVSEVHGAIIRYYAIKGWMPWCTATDVCDDMTTAVNLSESPMNTALSRIADSGELKSNFTELASSNLGKIWVHSNSSNDSVSVCFQPQSKSFRCDPNTRYNKDGTVHSPSTDCTENCGSQTTCYWCVQ